MEKHHVMAIEMETFHLLHLAKISKGTIHAAGCAFVMAQRKSQQMMNNATKERIEKVLGESCLQSLVDFPIEESVRIPFNCHLHTSYLSFCRFFCL
jgi:hypothetical protein